MDSISFGSIFRLYTIDHNQRILITGKCTHTADTQGGGIVTRLAASLHGKKSRHTAGKGITDICLRRLKKIFSRNCCNGACYRSLTLRSVCNHDCIIQGVGFIFKQYILNSLVADCERKCLVTNERHLNLNSCPRDSDRIPTFVVGHCGNVVLRGIDDSPDHRLGPFVTDNSGDCDTIVLHCCSGLPGRAGRDRCETCHRH